MSNQPWDPLYSSHRWRKLRARHLAANRLCVMCLPRPTVAKVVDHVKPHKGDMALFWDPANLQSLCLEHHNRVKQSQERGGTKTRLRSVIAPDGWPVE